MSFWKFLDEKNGSIVSRHGSTTWTIGKWEHTEGMISACSNGFHCSPTIQAAFSYVQGNVLALVEVRGEEALESNKSAHADMKIIKAYRWTKNDSVALAIHVAELVIGIFEDAFPADDRPRKAIEAARAYLQTGNSDAAAARAAAAAYADDADAARADFTGQIEAWMQERVSTLEEITPPRHTEFSSLNDD